jgi:alkylation response protein AidB-like acyl-CoA dehydrogenase
MTEFTAPVRDMRFVLNELGLLPQAAELPGCEEVGEELIDAILEEAGKFAGEVLSPLNQIGDQQGAVLENGVVRTADGFADAYRAFVDGGWGGVAGPADYGGQGLPWLVNTALLETWVGACTSWTLCPTLTMGAVELLAAHGTDAQKALYLPKLVSSEWAGTMNLTEPQAGSDLGALRCRAEPSGDHYKITGQKIFISFGEHDMAGNIVHMVLARTPDAPKGPRGISLFLVPKFLPNEKGEPGQRNDLRAVSLEHKLGIHASPTCVMSFGDDGGAVGYLVGEENQGLACMFTMMNNARMNIGISGIGLAERAYQHARDYARERNQFGPIIHHPDVRRMLMTMRALVEAMRALTYDTALQLDLSRRHPDKAVRHAAQSRMDLLTPVVKAWCSDNGVEVASLAVQVHGGMGYIEETGAAQLFRDSRIAPIYEGTNGIQAIDLVSRKVLRDEGLAVKQYIAEMREWGVALNGHDLGPAHSLPARLASGLDSLERATDWLLAQDDRDQARALSGATPYLKLFGTVAGGAMMARSVAAALAGKAAANGDAGFYDAKCQTAGFYADNILPQADALAIVVTDGADTVLGLEESLF